MRRQGVVFGKKCLSVVMLVSAVLLVGCGGGEQAGAPSEIVEEVTEGSVAEPDEAPAAEAVTMHLRKTEGTVAVADDEGADVPLLEQLGLYSGYQVDTREESYAWIDLDSVKLTKMDADSRVGIQKNGKKQGLFVHAGRLFFHVEEPLGPDESLDIHTSNMIVGIRGTCGWVDAADQAHVKVGILEGTVSCSADTVTEYVPGGTLAEISVTEDGQSQIAVRKLTVKDIPDFVLTEVTQNPELCEKILSETGLDVLNGDEVDWTALENIAYYGDVTRCAMTREQAGAFAEVLRGGMATLEEKYNQAEPGPFGKGEFRCYAGLFDPGNGIPALMFGGGEASASLEAREDGASIVNNHNGNIWEIWQYAEGQAVRVFPGENTENDVTGFYLYQDFLWYQTGRADLSSVTNNIYRFEDGWDTGMPDTSSGRELGDGEPADWTYSIDGSPVSQEEYDNWTAQWGGEYPASGYLAYVWNGGNISAGDITGFCPAEDVFAVLENS